MEPLLILAAVLVAIGVIGSLLPALPGPVLSFIGLFVLFLVKGTEGISILALVMFALGMLLLVALDYVAPILGAKFAGASEGSLMWAIGGALIGIVFFPPLGIFIGAMIGAIIGEMLQGKDFFSAAKAGFGVVLGSVVMILLQFIFSLVAAIYFVMRIL